MKQKNRIWEWVGGKMKKIEHADGFTLLQVATKQIFVVEKEFDR